MKSFQEILDYQNEDLLSKFAEFYDFSDAERAFIFEQLKKWLWVKALHMHQRALSPDDPALQFHFHVLPSLRVVDELWHVFILFTQEYREFCLKYLGVFVDHTPSLPHKTLPAEDLQAEIEKEMYFIGRNLDASTLELWFRGLKNMFPEDVINARYIYRKGRGTL